MDNKVEIESLDSITKAKRSILNDLERFSLPENVIHMAENIYQTLDIPTTKGSKRIYVCYYCTQQAYIKLNMPMDSDNLCKIFKIESKDVHKIQKMFITNTKTIHAQFTVEYYISQYVKKLIDEKETSGTSHIIDKACDIINIAKKKDITLGQERVQKLAIGAIRCALDELDVSYEESKLANIAGKAPITIKKTYLRILELYKKASEVE